MLTDDVQLRTFEPEDAAASLDAYVRNRDALRSTEPDRPDSFWTLEGHRTRLEGLIQRTVQGETHARGLFRGERLVGCATLNTIVRGPFCNASVGYWIDQDEQRRGLAAAAVAALCRIADADLGLHRLEAGVLPDNVASQRVLAKNAFVSIGRAADYLYIAGRWQEALLFQRILNDRRPPV